MEIQENTEPLHQKENPTGTRARTPTIATVAHYHQISITKGLFHPKTWIIVGMETSTPDEIMIATIKLITLPIHQGLEVVIRSQHSTGLHHTVRHSLTTRIIETTTTHPSNHMETEGKDMTIETQKYR